MTIEQRLRILKRTAEDRRQLMKERSKDEHDEHLRWYYHGVGDGIASVLNQIRDMHDFEDAAATVAGFLRDAHAAGYGLGTEAVGDKFVGMQGPTSGVTR